MVTLKDNNKIYKGLRKQFLNVKGNLYLELGIIDNNKKIRIIGSSGFMMLKSKVNQRRAIFQAITNAIYKALHLYNFSSSAKVYKIYNYGVKYGNDSVKIKTFKRYGKRYTGVWVKGSKGIKSLEKYNNISKKNLNKDINELGFNIDNDIYSNKY